MPAHRSWSRWLFWGTLCVYLATAHAAIRSPDAEVLFEVCDALRSRQTFAVEGESDWAGFGLARGRDGRLYSIFGPLQSIACAPLLAVVDAIEPLRIFDAIGLEFPPSHYHSGGLQAALQGGVVENREAHARRSAVAWIWGSVVGALGVATFFRIARRLTDHLPTALAVSLVYAFGSPIWAYAGTFFSEPLATLLLLLALDRLLDSEARKGEAIGAPILAGVFLGLAVWTHISAVLWVPFFAALFALCRPSLRQSLAFGLPLALVLGGLGLYHFLLYGDPFETGRSVGGVNAYARFIPPWRGLWGLLLSPGKGLFVHAPIALLAVVAWPALGRRHRALALVLGAALLFRLVFVASRSDWHGGFAQGPRLLVQGIPFLLLALVPWLKRHFGRRSLATAAFAGAAFVSVAIQWLLVAGEPFALLHGFRLDGLAAGVNVFENDALYLSSEFSVLGRIFEGPVGPVLARNFVSDPATLWLGGMYVLLPLALAGALVVTGEGRAIRSRRGIDEGLGGILLAALVLALYLPTLLCGFTNWDDPRYVHDNPFASRGWLGIPLAFVGYHEDAYYPVTHAIYSVIQALFGTSALAHHAVQVGIFAAGVALLPWALVAFGIPAGAGFWIALVWAAHPMRAESVSWVANLKDPAAFLGLVVAFGAYHRGRRRTSVVAFALALLSKSMFFPLAGLFVLLERRRASWEEAFRRCWPYLGVALVVALIGLFLHLLPSEERARTRPGGSLLGAIPSILYLPWWYLWRTLSLQHPQSVYTYEAVGWLDPRLALALFGWAVLGVLLWRAGQKRRPALAIGFAAWALPFLPVTGLSPLVHHLADRYAFLPGLAVVAALVLGVQALAPRLPRRAPALIGALAVLVQVPPSLARQADYRDAISLWEADLAREPDNFTVRYNLAGAYGGEGRWDDAVAQLEAARAILPGRQVDYWLAFARLARAGVPDEAVPRLAEQLALAEDPVPVWLEAARELVEAKQFGEARSILAELPAARDDVLLFSAALDAAEGREEEALARLDKAIARDPGLDRAHVLRAMLLAKLGRDEELVRLTDIELRSSAERAELARLRALALLRLGRYEEALAATEVAVSREHRARLAPVRAAALVLLGRAPEARRLGPAADPARVQAILDELRR